MITNLLTQYNLFWFPNSFYPVTISNNIEILFPHLKKKFLDTILPNFFYKFWDYFVIFLPNNTETISSNFFSLILPNILIFIICTILSFPMLLKLIISPFFFSPIN